MRIVELVLTPEEAFREGMLLVSLRARLGLSADDPTVVRPIRRSIDARSRKNVLIRVRCEVYPSGEPLHDPPFHRDFKPVSGPPVVVVGSGPAGLFAALRLIEHGLKPIVLERGKDVKSRRRDLAAINKEQIVNPDSNYCFGEGGAGTYSDGKLYTRSNKRGPVRRVLQTLVMHGALEDILIDAHPHIGTNKLPAIVAALRETVRASGGEIHFNTRVRDLVIKNGATIGVNTLSGDFVPGIAVILATGHSARDVYEMLVRNGVKLEAKPYALGLRVEHEQQLIDKLQYHCVAARNEYLPASSYSLVHQVQGRGVFSFCMCPGGFIVPAATSPGEVVVNGMSPSRRDSRFANSGMVVTVDQKDFAPYASFGPLAGMQFQAAIEMHACQIAGGLQQAPAQRLMDFVEGKVSPVLRPTSYQPGLVSADLHEVLPPAIAGALRQALIQFGKQMRGFLTNDAQLVGVESRTSAPVTIPRDAYTLQHPGVGGLFPCGEGAGYAGGIVSAAMDGERCAEAVAQSAGIRSKSYEE